MKNRKRYNKHNLSDTERWLERYQNAIAEEKLLQERIDSLDARAKSTTKRLSDMPKGNAVDVIPSLSDERDRLLERVQRSQTIKNEILSVISQLPDDERRLLEAYYIDGKTIEKAADFVPCVKRTAIEMKNRALLKIATLLE